MLKRLLLVGLVSTLVGAADAAKFIPLPMLPGDQGGYAGEATGVSGDGRVVVGASDAMAASGSWQAYRWTRAAGTQALGNLPGVSLADYSFANGVSRDGVTVVGTSRNSAGNFEGFRWTASSGMQGAGIPPGYTNSRVYAISDAGVYVGDTNTSASRRAFVQAIAPAVFADAERAYDISSNGAIVTGNVYESLQFTLTQAYRYTVANGGFELLDPMLLTRSNGLAVSDDGAVIVGWQQTQDLFGSLNPRQAFRWTPAGVELLGYYAGLTAGTTEARDVSGNGGRVAGVATGMDPTTNTFKSRAVVWDAAGGMRTVADEIAPFVGSALNGWELERATAISSDGRTVVGNGRLNGGESTPWLAYLPGPVSWTSLSSDWTNPGNWSGGFVPDLYDDATIAPDLFLSVDLPVGARELDTLTLGQSEADPESWTTNLRAPGGSQLTVHGVATIRERGTLELSSGQLSAARIDNYGAITGTGSLTAPVYNFGGANVPAGQSIQANDWVQYPKGDLFVGVGGLLSVSGTLVPLEGARGFGEVSVSGLLRADLPATFEGDLTMGNPLGSQLQIALAPGTATPVAKVSVGGELSLAGELRVTRSFFASYNAGDEFDILDWGTLSGQFASITVDTVPGLTWDLSQLYNSGVIRLVENQADFNFDGRVDAADYDVWVANYGATGATASQGDGNGDGLVNTADFTVWRDAVALAAARGLAIPELGAVTTAALLLGALIAISERRSL